MSLRDVRVVNAVRESPLERLIRTFTYPSTSTSAADGRAHHHTSAFNLVTSIVGCGILSTPWAFAQAGTTTAVALLTLTALVTWTSCNMLMVAYRKTRKSARHRINTYDVLARALFGRAAGVAVRAAIVLLCFGGIVANMVIIRQLSGPALTQLLGLPQRNDESGGGASAGGGGNHYSPGLDSFSAAMRDPGFLGPVALFLVVVVPLSSRHALAALGSTSIMALLCAMAVVTIVGIKAVLFVTDAGGAYACAAEGTAVSNDTFTWGVNVRQFLLAVPVFSFSFICQLNVVPVFEDLAKATTQRMRGVLAVALVVVTALYAVMGTVGQLRFCGATPGNILLGFRPPGNASAHDSAGGSTRASGGRGDGDGGGGAVLDTWIAACMLAETAVCTLSLPMIVFPARKTLHNALVSTFPKFTVKIGPRANPFGSPSPSPPSRPPTRNSGGDGGGNGGDGDGGGAKVRFASTPPGLRVSRAIAEDMGHSALGPRQPLLGIGGGGGGLVGTSGAGDGDAGEKHALYSATGGVRDANGAPRDAHVVGNGGGDGGYAGGDGGASDDSDHYSEAGDLVDMAALHSSPGQGDGVAAVGRGSAGAPGGGGVTHRRGAYGTGGASGVNRTAASGGVDGSTANDEGVHLCHCTCELPQEPPLAIRVAETLAIVAGCFVIALVVPGFEVVVGFLGATLASLVCYILPSMFYLWVCRNDHPPAPLRKQLVGYAVLVYGVGISVVGTVENIAQLLHPRTT